ncbi:MAG: DUF2846 domain-containing protein [Bdellovibrionaceae bacterium]|nr:DUF2846 domain-containing protein [Pseudobdellovibrionaceae bacterium]
MVLAKIAGFFSLMLVLCSCATVNVAEQRSFAKPDSKKSTIYFYRESAFAGWSAKYNIWEDESKPQKIGALKNGSYFFITVPPGKKTFFVNGEVRSAVTLDMLPGKTYYIQNNINMGFWVARPKLTEVTESEALRQIKDTDIVMTVL